MHCSNQSHVVPHSDGVGNGSRDDQSDHLYEQYMYTRVTGLASPGNTNSSSGSSHSNNESNAHNPAAVWNQQLQQQQQQHQHKVPTSTLSRNKDQPPPTKINNHLLRNNLLSSSVRDLLSTTLQHPNPQQHVLLNDPNIIRTTNLDVNNTYAPLIERQHCKKVIRSNEFDKMNTLVQSQSGSRFILTSDYTGDSTTMIPSSTLIMRPGITTSRTVGSKVIRPDVNAGFGPSTFESSCFGKSLKQHVSWKCTAVAFITTCVLLFASMIFILSRPSSTSPPNEAPHYNCPVMSEDSSSNVLPSFAPACPVFCSGRGQYVRGSCICSSGWKGRECELRKDQCDPVDCNRNGDCVDGDCVCKLGWKGAACESSISLCDVSDCHGHGSCVDGECRCNAGWRGILCEQKASECQVADCNGRGSCRSGTCDCRPGFKGQHCEIEECIDPSCSGHGSCFDGRCICKPGWRGFTCSQLDGSSGRDFPNCSGHGIFDPERERCSCFAGFTGDNCAIEKCGLDCGKHGSCEGSGCVCSRGWAGDRCQDNVCDPKCHEHGKCMNGTCICNLGFYGKHCTLNGCPAECSGDEHGECSVEEESDDSSGYSCHCKAGWTGADCSQALETSCNDNVDNDNDGLIDCADSECCSRPECRDSLMCLTSPEPLDILLRKPPPSVTASFYQKMKFLIEDGSVQSYPHRDEYAESFTTRFIPGRASVIRGQVISPSGSGLMGIRVGIANDPLLGFVVSRESGWFDIMVNGGSAVVLHLQREPFRPIEKAVAVPWNEIVVIDPIMMSVDEAKSIDDSSAEHRSQICPEHDYESMKPLVYANWKNYPCSPAGLLADGHVLHESLPIPSTDFSLVYNSSRVSGYKSVIEIGLTSDHVPETLKLIHLKVTLEGVLFRKTFEPESNLRYTYGWNRRNVYRQKVFGVANAIVSIGFEYQNCGSLVWDTQSVQLPGHDMAISEIGGFNLNIHHRYNFQEGILQKGDGSAVYLKKRPKVMANIMGDGEQRPLHCPYCNGPGISQRLLAPMALASAPDGSIYVGDFNLIRRLAPDGEVNTVVELSASQVAYKYHLAIGPVDGKLYLSDPERHQVLRTVNAINPEDASKNLEVVIGSGVKCLPGDKHHCGDGRPAKEARLSYPKGLAINLNNELFVADGTNIRFVDKAGVMHTLIGDHHHKSFWKPFPCSGSMPMQKANLRWPTELAINPLDNSLHILDDHMVLQISSDKRLQIVAGRPTHCSHVVNPEEGDRDQDQAKATSVFLETPSSIAFSPQGSLLIAESDAQLVNRIRVVTGSGRISRFAGADSKCSCLDKDCDCYNQDNALALNSKLNSISSVTVTPAGEVIVCDQGNLRIRSIKPFLPQPNKAGEYEIISQDTMEIYVFNKHGLHVATKSGLTGKSVYNFTYVVNTSFGKLSSVTDASGSRVQLLRDYSNQVKEIETSAGSKCRIDMSRTRLLETYILPDNSKITFTYNGLTGLIKSKSENASGRAYSYEYDKNGRLIRASGPDNEDVKCMSS